MFFWILVIAILVVFGVGIWWWSNRSPGGADDPGGNSPTADPPRDGSGNIV